MWTASLFCLVTTVLAETAQLLLLLDISGGYPFSDDYVQGIRKVVATASSVLPGIQIGVADFTDKPNVASGVGRFGGYPRQYTEDWCYKSWLPFTTAYESVFSLLPNLPPGSGLDIMEGQFEALMRAVYDEFLGWSMQSRKIVLMVTDSYGHSQALDTLDDHVKEYNAPVRCVGDTSVGGFGALQPDRNIAAWTVSIDGGFDLYQELAQLLWIRNCDVGASLTAEQETRLDELIHIFSPISVAPVQPFNLTVMLRDPSKHCRFHEYPSYTDIVTAFSSRGFELIVLFTGTDSSVWEWALTDADSGLGQLHATLIPIASLDSSQVAQALTRALAP